MRLIPILIFALASITQTTWACSCAGGENPCGFVGSKDAIFVARVVVDSGEGWGTGPARVVVEEALQNVPEGLKETVIDTMAHTSCYFRLVAGERYVIIGRANPGYSVGGCSPSFRVRGNEHILDAIRNQVNGGAPRLVGKVRKNTGEYSQGEGIGGATVSLTNIDEDGNANSGGRVEATTDTLGRYVILGLNPGRYRMHVASQGFVPDLERNSRPTGVYLVPRAGETKNAKTQQGGTITISAGACSIWNLAMWPAGRIRGKVQRRGSDPAQQKSLGGITVQAFGFDRQNERDSSPLRTATTSAEDGSFTIEPLPAGRYVIAINGRKYKDEDAYPPTFHADGQPVYLTESGTLEGIDLELPAARKVAKLRVNVVGPDGTPYPGRTSVSLENLTGVERWFTSRPETGGTRELEVPVYVGERYVVRVSDFVIPDDSGNVTEFEGITQVAVTDDNAGNLAVTVMIQPRERSGVRK